MSLFSGKKIFLLGFIVVLLVAIPLTVYLAQQQQKTNSGAAPSTTFTLVESGKTNSDVSTTVGQDVNFDIMVNPGSNAVGFVSFNLSYDGTKLATDGAGLVPNIATGLPNVASGPIYSTNNVSITLSVGASPQNSLTVPTKIATITFKAISSTEGTPTQITFQNGQAMSTSGESSCNENVLSSTIPANVTIGTGNITPTVTFAPTVTQVPTATPVPTITQAANQLPICSSLTVDTSSGSAPLAVNFTAAGTDPDGTVSKATFNYGDGTVEDVAQGTGIGTNSVSIVHAHTFNAGGTFSANVVFTDNSGGVSTPSSCTQTITVAGGTVQPTVIAATSVPPPPSVMPTALPPTGPGDQIMAVGALGGILTVVGFVLLFAL